MAFLDKTGLTKLWAKIKATFAKKEQAVYYIEGTGTTAGTWLGSHDDITAYHKGLTVAYKLNVAGASTTTLNINGLGAKTVYINTGKLTTHVPVGSVVVLVYDGTYWRWSNYDTTNTYQLRKYYGSHLASTTIYRYQILLTQKDNKLLPINTTSNSTATTKTLTTASFDPFGAIYFYNTTGTVSAGAAPTVSYLYTQVLADLRYSFNTGTTLTANKPVYMVCELQSDGLFKLASTPITQALPTSADTKYYLYLGQAHDTYRIELSLEHPIYYYNGTKISVYTGITDSDYVKSSLVDNSTTWTQTTQNNIPTKFSVANYISSGYAAKTHTHKVTDISDFPTSLPASDVSAWAKAASKPSYAWSEITSKPSWIGSSKPSYAWSEITSKPSWIGSSKPTYTASEVSAISSGLYDNSDTWSSATSDNVPTKRSIAAYLSTGYATKTHTHSDYLPTSGGTLTGNVDLPNDATGITCSGTGMGFFNADGYPGIATEDFSIFVSAEFNSSNGFWIYFPQKPCTLAAEDDIIHAHNIYILPGGSGSGGVYIYFTLHCKKSTIFSNVAEITAELYNGGNTTQYFAVSATGRASSSSSNYSNSMVIAVYASSASVLNVVLMSPSTGSISTVSYNSSVLTSFRDVVR